MDPDDTTPTGDDPEPLVRPKGFAADHPVVRRIGERDLYLGNAHAADPERHDRGFAYVLSVSRDTHPLTTHHRPLFDGPGNEWAAFEDAVDTARRLHDRSGPVLVNCKAGISRSSAVLATTIAAEEGMRFSEARDVVQAARPFATPHPALVKLGVVYLAANGIP